MKIMNDYLRVNQMTVQTWTACLQMIALRAEMMATHSPLSVRLISENIIMGTEKISASLEVYSQIQSAADDFCYGRFDPLTAWENMLRPINKKAMNNARRLYRQTRR